MKKFVKMSLVAALAVAGTTASAQPLAEAIQNVDVTGTVVYRYDDRANDNQVDTNGVIPVGTGDATNNNYKIGVSLSSKVNDDVKFNSRILFANPGNNNFVGLDTATNDTTSTINLSQANFSYTGLANTTVVVGKQGLATPWTNAIDSDGSEQTGTGILAATTMGPVTAAAGYFNQTNIPVLTANGEDVVVAGLMGKLAMVNVEAWYLDVAEVADSVFVAANASFDVDAVKIGLDAKYSTLDMDNQTPANDDMGNFEVGITAKMGIFNAGIAYAESDTDGDAIVNSLAKNGQIGYTVDLNGTTDAQMWMFDLGMQVTPELHVGLNYDVIDDQDANQNDDHSEAYIQVTYNMSKNLSTYVRLAQGEDRSTTGAAETDVDYNRGRLQVEYKF